MMNENLASVYLSLGSNLGDREINLLKAIEQLPPLVNVVKKSQVYETEPWGYLDQPKFLNQVLQVKTALSPLELLLYLQEIEKSLGRMVDIRFGPRKIDIDILIYGDLIIDLKNLIIPHKRMTERAFVLVPLGELCPDLIVPGTELSISKFLETIDTDGVYLYQE